MITYSITVSGLDKAQESLIKFTNLIKQSLQRALVQSVTYVTNEAKINAPYRSGTLRRSIHNQLDLVNLRGWVIAATPYAEYVEVGTAAHTIYPKRAKVLAFKVGGKMVFARKVQHPGFSGRWYMKKTAEGSQDMVNQFFSHAITLATNAMKG